MGVTSNLCIFILLVNLFYCNGLATLISSESDTADTTVSTVDVEKRPNGTIEHRLIGKPHHLFIGRCNHHNKVLHQENIIVHNDGKSHVAADIKVHVTDPVYITCVKIYDEVPEGKGGYPSYIGGGVGYDYVEFHVDTDYGTGFHFFVEVKGYTLDHKTP